MRFRATGACPARPSLRRGSGRDHADNDCEVPPVFGFSDSATIVAARAGRTPQGVCNAPYARVLRNKFSFRINALDYGLCRYPRGSHRLPWLPHPAANGCRRHQVPDSVWHLLAAAAATSNYWKTLIYCLYSECFTSSCRSSKTGASMARLTIHLDGIFCDRPFGFSAGDDPSLAVVCSLART